MAVTLTQLRQAIQAANLGFIGLINSGLIAMGRKQITPSEQAEVTRLVNEWNAFMRDAQPEASEAPAAPELVAQARAFEERLLVARDALQKRGAELQPYSPKLGAAAGLDWPAMLPWIGAAAVVVIVVAVSRGRRATPNRRSFQPRLAA